MHPELFLSWALILLATLTTLGTEVVVDDRDGTLGQTRAPVVASVKLSKAEWHAVEEGRLGLAEVGQAKMVLPVQRFATNPANARLHLVWLMPPGPHGQRKFALKKTRPSPQPTVVARFEAASGQYDLTDAGRPVLRYNYATIEPGDFVTNVAPASRIYAQARSDYIHPLFGLDGETLTKDWSVDHPHHRGIYWAWPEVDWRGQRGDLHALQKVFARPTGECKMTSGPVFAQLEAENVWKWENGETLVRERAVVRAYHTAGDDRMVDLEFQFTALNDPVLLARRGTLHYGGLNLRFAKVADQEIIWHTDPTNATPRMAWAELSGKFPGAPTPGGVVVLQHRTNPDYPGDWVKFPELNWMQPTFPASGTRYELQPGKPLILRFRLWLHRGAKAGADHCAVQWRTYQSPLTPAFLSTP